MNLKKQIRSISRPTDKPGKTGFELKNSVYFSNAMNNGKLSTNNLRKQPLVGRVRKTDRNDEYFVSRLQENHAITPQ